jgi:hypothetical protein
MILYNNSTGESWFFGLLWVRTSTFTSTYQRLFNFIDTNHGNFRSDQHMNSAAYMCLTQGVTKRCCLSLLTNRSDTTLTVFKKIVRSLFEYHRELQKVSQHSSFIYRLAGRYDNPMPESTLSPMHKYYIKKFFVKGAQHLVKQ